MSLPVYVVDAFADAPFRGNPAGVCPILDGQTLTDERMQAIAAEMNHAETAFLWPEGDGYRLRWFTPTVEVDLCGHATLASAHVLFEIGALLPGDNVIFHTRSGELTAAVVEEGIRLDFPSEEPEAASLPQRLELGSPIVWTGRNRMDWFVEVESEAGLRSMTPDLASITALGMRGLIVTAKSTTPDVDFVSRCFFPQSGVAEDPVTGSAHCALAPYWGEKLETTSLKGYQASARGGTVIVELVDNRVHLTGRAVTVLKGELVV